MPRGCVTIGSSAESIPVMLLPAQKKKAVEKFRWLKTRTLENLFGKGSASNRKIYTIAAAGVFMLKCNAFVTYVIDVTTSNMTMPLHCTESCFVYDVGYLNEWVARSFGTLRARQGEPHMNQLHSVCVNQRNGFGCVAHKRIYSQWLQRYMMPSVFLVATPERNATATRKEALW